MALKKGTKAKPKRAATLSARALRSRQKLKDAALRLLNTKGYGSLRNRYIAKEAEVAEGLFYRYFRDLDDLVYELCTDMFDQLRLDTLQIPERTNPYDQIYEFVYVVVNRFSKNLGILACMFELPVTHKRFNDLWNQQAQQWSLHFASFVEKATGMTRADSEKMAFMLGAEMEGIIYQGFIRRTRSLTELGKRPSEISELIAGSWYRTLFLEPPPRNKVKHSRFLLG